MFILACEETTCGLDFPVINEASDKQAALLWFDESIIPGLEMCPVISKRVTFSAYGETPCGSAVSAMNDEGTGNNNYDFEY